MPDKGMICVADEASRLLSESTREPLMLPLLVGVKLMLSVQLWLGASVPPVAELLVVSGRRCRRSC